MHFQRVLVLSAIAKIMFDLCCIVEMFDRHAPVAHSIACQNQTFNAVSSIWKIAIAWLEAFEKCKSTLGINQSTMETIESACQKDKTSRKIVLAEMVIQAIRRCFYFIPKLACIYYFSLDFQAWPLEQISIVMNLALHKVLRK